MRITSFILFNQLTRSLQENMRTLFKYSNRLSTGKKITKLSDDVSGMTRSIDYKTRINENNQYIKNIDDASSYLEFTDSVMSGVTTSLTRARELTIQASTGTQSAESRAAIAEEIANLRDEIFSLSNSQFRDRYIFSGYSSDTAPFDSSYNFQGDSGEINVMIDRNSTIATNIPGNTAFSYGGTTFMKTLDDLYNTLIDPASTEADISAYISPLDNALEQTANVRTDVGARLGYLDKYKITLEDRTFALKTFLSNTEDADITESVSELAKTEVTLQSLRAASSEILSQSLLNFLR